MENLLGILRLSTAQCNDVIFDEHSVRSLKFLVFKADWHII